MLMRWMSYVSVVLGSNVLFLLMLLTANLKASSSALTSETGPSVCSKIPPDEKETRARLKKKEIELQQGTTRGEWRECKNEKTETSGFFSLTPGER